MDKEELQELYQQDAYYWGKEANQLARKIRFYAPAAGHAVDLGAGEGRDSVYLAQQGYNVLAVDLATSGLDKAIRLAKESGVTIDVQEGDINDFQPPQPVDLLYSIGALQYVQPNRRSEQFRLWKKNTSVGGMHVLFAFNEHPDVALAPDWGRNEYLYQREELQSYYIDWELLYTEAYIFDCSSSGIPHQHAASMLIARKPFA
ncbi:methyltransferase domain-containing protein [Paenibacillus sp. SYP-B3998]|uniref:Methyltransferase domain-containing protein n=1 Tax=Paenibacillus sp. SYP-B3998 TaxID=2678564 RepID=A0A6G4A3Z6_9BACL|nr:methyltransferase domain-containing protein [Paenibacillus sp. SYP-B3998]NEW09226.1 methyltransferase domain-containing protein [Paenibacillus sp. SYP-B3998]